MDTRPNLILLVADQFRGDCLGIDGHPDVKTPHLDSLAAEGVTDSTVILFVSDHGEMLGDHLLFRKAKPFQGSARVPLFLSGPERLVGRGVRGDLAELRDAMPTLLELAGAPVPGTVDGRSLLRPAERSYLHGEHALGEDSMHFIVTPADKFVWYSQTGRELYFDLERDPHETHNAVDDPGCASRAAQLRRLLIGELAGREEGYSDGERLIAGRPPRNVLTAVCGGEGGTDDETP